MDNRLKLTTLGRQAVNNASAGGLLVRPVKFKVGDSDFPHSDDHTDIQGNTVFEGDIYFVEVLDEFSTRFTFFIPDYVPPAGGIDIKEGAIFFENNVMFARCVFTEAYTLHYQSGTEIVAIITTNECDLSTIDVTIGSYSSIPVTPFIRQLPSPVLSTHNVISVLDALTNIDGTTSPAFALRFGQGNFQWAFSSHERAYIGVPDSGPSINSFKRATISADNRFANGEIVIVNIVSGPGAGETRRFSYSQLNDNFMEADAYPFSILDSSSTISIWKRIEGGCCGCGCSGSTEDQTVVNQIPALPMFATSVAGIDTTQELENLLTSATELSNTSNQNFTINVVDNDTGGGGTTIQLRPIFAVGQIGADTEAEIGNLIAVGGTELPNTNNGQFTIDTGSSGGNYGYFIAPEELGDVVFTDTATSFSGGWDGAKWPDDGSFSFETGPVLFTRTVGGVVTNWRVYRMDFPDVGQKIIDYTFEFAGATPSVTTGGSGTGGTLYGYFVYPSALGAAVFTDTSDNSTNDWTGASSPITLTRNIGDNPSTWLLYRTTNAGIGNKVFNVAFTNPGITVNMPQTTVIPGTSGSGAGGNCCDDSLPSRINIPDDWTLIRGAGDFPVWAPPRGGSEIVSTLYQAPGRLRVTNLSLVGDGVTRRYNLGGIVLKDNNYMVAALGGIFQHKTAFDIEGSEIEFAEPIPSNVSIDLRMYTKDPGNGTYIDFVTNKFVGDGQETRFTLTFPIDGAEYCFVHIQSVLQGTVSYTYDAATQQIVFTQPPSPGNSIEITLMVRRQEDGYSTEMITQQLITVGQTLFVELPIHPQTKDMTFLSVSGSHIHRDLYTVVDNNLVLSSPIPAGREVEVLIFNNVKAQGSSRTNLTGVVVDAILTSKSLKLIRHDAKQISLPIPAVEFKSGRGIKITGIHPVYTFESTIAEAFTSSTNFKMSTLQKESNSNEIIYSWRLNLTDDVLLTVIADFSAELGPGFVSPAGLERMEYVIGFRTTSMREPEYGRQIKGTGTAGFSALPSNGNDQKAYANASLTQVFEVIKNNIPAGYIDIIAKMRIKEAETSKYESLLMVNFNVIGTPKINIA